MRVLFFKAFALADAGQYNRKKGATIGNKCYGYIRVSSKDQNEECQLIALQEKGVENDLIYIDKRLGEAFLLYHSNIHFTAFSAYSFQNVISWFPLLSKYS